MTGLRREDVVLGTGAHVDCLGKGRKRRCTPLTKQAASALKLWFQEPMRGDGQIVFPNARGTRLSPDGVQYLLAKHIAPEGALRSYGAKAHSGINTSYNNTGSGLGLSQTVALFLCAPGGGSIRSRSCR